MVLEVNFWEKLAWPLEREQLKKENAQFLIACRFFWVAVVNQTLKNQNLYNLKRIK